MTRGGQVRVNWSRGETGPEAASIFAILVLLERRGYLDLGRVGEE